MRPPGTLELSRPRIERTFKRAGISLLALAALLAGCHLRIPDDPRTPSVAGVVEEITRLPDGGVSYRLANGQTADVASRKTVLLGGEPVVGELLLLGIDPDGGQWAVGLSAGSSDRPEGCFFLPSQGRSTADAVWIDTTAGLRLPKAPGFFDPRDRHGNEFDSERGGFCLNDRGEVTSYEP